MIECNKTKPQKSQAFSIWIDGTSFGGHEIMLFRHLTNWGLDKELVFFLHKDNVRAISQIEEKFPDCVVKLRGGNCRAKYHFFSYVLTIILGYIGNFRRKTGVAIVSVGGIGSGFKGYNLFWLLGSNKIWWYVPMVFPPEVWYRKIFYRLCVLGMDNFITVSKFQLNLFKKHAHNSCKSYLLRNFLDLDRFLPKSYESGFVGCHDSSKESYDFLVIGRCHSQKGLDKLAAAVQCFHIRNERHNNLKINIKAVGCRENDSLFRDVVSKYDHLSIEPVKWSDNPFAQRFDAVLMPSRYEGDPLLIHECRLLKVPIFVNAIECLGGVLLDNEKVDFDDLENCIDSIINRLCSLTEEDLTTAYITECKLNERCQRVSIEFYNERLAR